MANLYNPDQLGIKPPSGGFQQGGWYQGRQYWNGQFSDPGVINPLSNQQGAGSAVSSEVNRQSDPLQGLQPGGIDAYLEEQRNNAPAVTPVTTTPSLERGATPATGTSGGTPGTGIGTGAGGLLGGQASINLPELYKSIYKDSGIEQTELQLSEKEKAYNDALSKINDNPYLSEATRVGRAKKLSIDYENSVASLKNDVVTKKADIETKLALETKQFDINTEQAKLALSQFDTLLNMGALDNASGDEIAAITRTTGLTSSMIQNAVQSRKDKSVETSTISYDDGTNQGFAIINSKTGEIISKQVIAASKPTKTGVGGLTDTQERSYTTDAIKILNDIDSQYRVDKSGKAVKVQFEEDYGGDKLLSRSELELARQKVIESVGGDQQLGKELFQKAFEGGGFKIYGN